MADSDNPDPNAGQTLAPKPPSEPAPEGDRELGVAPGAKVCGNCRLFKAVVRENETWKGDCRVMLDRGMFPATAPTCNKFLPRAAPVPRALPKDPERASRRPQVAPLVRKPDVLLPELETMTREELKAILREALEETSEVRLAPKWEGGMIVLKPGEEGLQAKELPIDALFHKVVMLRDRLRQLEQKLNSHAKLSDVEKAEMQQYVTRCYGSLTSFNLLFADKDDGFVGEKGKEA